MSAAPDDESLEQGGVIVASQDGKSHSEQTGRRRIGVRWALCLLILVSVSVGSLGWRIFEYGRQQQIITELEQLGARLENADPRRSEWGTSPNGWVWGLFQISLANPLSRVTGVSCPTSVSDATLVHLEKLQNLQWLRVDGGADWNTYDNVTNAGLEYLKTMDSLTFLSLNRTAVTDAGLGHLERLNNLKTLRLVGTGVTDAGLPQLAGLTSLESLELSSQVTDDAAATLRLKLPGTSVYVDRPAGKGPFQCSDREGQITGPWYVGWTDSRGVPHYVDCGNGIRGNEIAKDRIRQVQSELNAGRQVMLKGQTGYPCP